MAIAIPTVASLTGLRREPSPAVPAWTDSSERRGTTG